LVVKDYYKILGVPPNASLSDIKRGFRHLAQRYHPDKHGGSKHAEAWYREVYEAYTTLTDPALREVYHQQRWLQQSLGRPLDNPLPLTPENILAEVESTCQQAKNLDQFRMDQKGLGSQLAQLISEDKIEALRAFGDESINYRIVYCMQDALVRLDFPYLGAVQTQLLKLSAGNIPMKALVKGYFEKRRRQHWWIKNQWWIVLAITAALCAMVFTITNY
jgi:hypothetical protein